jgi:heptosyltransferase-2
MGSSTSAIEQKMKNILIMHTGGWIGDMILLTPTLRALKSKFPDCRMTMLLLPLVSELMKRNPYLDEVIVYDKRNGQKGFRQMQKMAKNLRSKSFDTAIILHPNSVKSAILAYMAHIPKRIGLKLIGNGFFLTTKVKRRKNVHEVQRYLDIITPIAGTGFSEKLEFWGIEQTDEEFVNDILKFLFPPFERGIKGDLLANNNLVVGLNVSTTWKTKQWSIEKFASLTELLYSELGAFSVLTGGKSDIELGEKIMGLASDSEKYILDLTGKTTLWQLGAIIKHCDFYVTCDSGPMHISAALGTPTIALFGPTDPIRHRPYGEGHIVIRKDVGCCPCYKRECKKGVLCMDAIQVEDVFESARKFLPTP